MCEAYIGAGLDPARFWDVTPRLALIEMNGAELRHRRDRANVWLGAAMSRAEKLPTFEKFVGIDQDRSTYVRQFDDAWDRLDRSLERNRK